MNRRGLIASIVLPLFFGLMSMLREMGRPEFDLIRKLDVVQLAGAGFCFGIAFMSLLVWIKGPHKA